MCGFFLHTRMKRVMSLEKLIKKYRFHKIGISSSQGTILFIKLFFFLSGMIGLKEHFLVFKFFPNVFGCTSLGIWVLLQSNLEKKYHPSGLRRDANKLQLSETFFSIWKSCSAKAKETKIFFAVLCCSERHKKEVRTCFLGLGRQKNLLYASVCQLLKKLAESWEDKPLPRDFLKEKTITSRLLYYGR